MGYSHKCDFLIYIYGNASLFSVWDVNKRHTPAVVKRQTLPQCRWHTCIFLLSHFSIWSVLHGMEENTSGLGGQLWPAGLLEGGGCDCKVATLTPQTIWGPRGRRGGRRGRMKSTLVHATPRLEWPYVRFSDTGQLPLNPAVWGTRSMMFASQGGLTGCTNEENCKVDSSKTKCQSVDFRAGSFWWIRATQMKLEGTWKSIDEYWATASPFQEYHTPLLAKGGKKKPLTFG